jgi:hypothetical protein
MSDAPKARLTRDTKERIAMAICPIKGMDPARGCMDALEECHRGAAQPSFGGPIA